MSREHPSRGRKFARISLDIWDDPDFVALSLQAQHLYFVLLSQRKLDWSGVLHLNAARWASLSNTTEGDIAHALDELAEAKFVVIDKFTAEVLVRSFLRLDPAQAGTDGGVNTNLLRAALLAASRVDSTAIRQALVSECGRIADRLPPDAAERFPDLSEFDANAQRSTDTETTLNALRATDNGQRTTNNEQRVPFNTPCDTPCDTPSGRALGGGSGGNLFSKEFSEKNNDAPDGAGQERDEAERLTDEAERLMVAKLKRRGPLDNATLKDACYGVTSPYYTTARDRMLGFCRLKDVRAPGSRAALYALAYAEFDDCGHCGDALMTDEERGAGIHVNCEAAL